MTLMSPRDRLRTWCSLLDRIVVGRAAAAALDEGRDLEPGLLFILPTWLWVEPGIDVGRKGVADDGSLLPMPIRVSSPGSPVQVLSDPSDLAFTAAGLGISTAGVVTVRAGYSDACHPAHVADQDIFSVRMRTPAELRVELRRLDVDGHNAWCEALMWPEEQVRTAIEKAHTFLAHDVAKMHGGTPTRLIDRTAVEEILTSMTIGSLDATKPSALARIIERSLLPLTFLKVDPLYYLEQSLRRDAHVALRQHMGDPESGPRIRKSALEAGGVDADPDEILAWHNRKYPLDNLGMGRLMAALSVAPTVTARATGLQSWAS